MVSSSDFGVASCNMRRAPRYHAYDYVDGPYVDAYSEDPMVWPWDLWTSDSFSGYSLSYNDEYDRRFRGQPQALAWGNEVVEIETEVETTEDGEPQLGPHGFKIGQIDGGRVRWTVYKTTPRGEPATHNAQILSGGKVCTTCNAGVMRPATRCPEGGSLVITWTDGAAEYRCATPRSFHRWVR